MSRALHAEPAFDLRLVLLTFRMTLFPNMALNARAIISEPRTGSNGGEVDSYVRTVQGAMSVPGQRELIKASPDETEN